MVVKGGLQNIKAKHLLLVEDRNCFFQIQFERLLRRRFPIPGSLAHLPSVGSLGVYQNGPIVLGRTLK